jgi:hypothetical protein
MERLGGTGRIPDLSGAKFKAMILEHWKAVMETPQLLTWHLLSSRVHLENHPTLPISDMKMSLIVREAPVIDLLMVDI